MSVLPKGWVEAPVEEIVAHDGNSIADGPYGSKLKSSHYTGQGARVIRLSNIGRRQYLPSSEAFISMEYFEELRGHEVIKGDIVMAALGDPIGRCCEVPTEVLPAIVKADCFRIRLGSAVAPNFFLYLMNSAVIATRFAEEAHGVGRLRINLSDLRQLRLPLPPLAEQKRIVAKLDALTAKSTRARTELARIETLVARYKQAVLGKAFSGEMTREWRHEVDWPAPVRLGDVASSFAYGSAAKSQKAGSVPVLRMGNIQQGRLDWSDLVYTDDMEEIEKYRLKTGDVLFNRTNSPALVGKTALFTGEREAIFAGYLIRVVAGSALKPEYLTYALNSPDGRRFSWDAKTDGVSQSNISASKLKEFSFSVPTIEEQHEIVRRIETAFARIDRLAAEAKRALALLGKLDEAILAKAFRGELVPQDETDEPAEQLLARIRAERAAAPKAKRGRRKSA